MWTDHMRDRDARLDLHWVAGNLRQNDSRVQVQHAARSAESSGAGLCYRRVDDLLQPAIAGGDGEDLRRAGRPGDVCGRGHPGGIRAGAAAVRPTGRFAGAPRVDDADVRCSDCGAAAVSAAPTLAWLIAGSVLLGGVASVTHIVLPIAPDLVPDKERGRAIGTVMMGLLLGILLARTFAGWVSRIPALFVHAPSLFPKGAFWVTDGWRYVFIIAALVNAGFLVLLGRV